MSRGCTEERIRSHDGARCERVILALLRSRGLLSVRLLCFTHEPDWKILEEEMKRGGTADATRDWQPHPEASQWCCQGNGHLLWDFVNSTNLKCNGLFVKIFEH